MTQAATEPNLQSDPPQLAAERSSLRILRGSLGTEVFRFGLPLALGMGLQVTFNLVDAYLVSHLQHGTSEAAIGAIGICDQVAALGSIISYGISLATATVMSQRQGRGDNLGARRVAWQSTLLVLALGALFALVGLFGSGWLMHDLVGAKGRVAELGESYLRVMVGGNVTIFLLLHLTTMQRALGSSKSPVALLVLSNLVNLLLAVLLIYGPGSAPTGFTWGPPIARAFGLPRLELLGAAWATVLARLVGLIPLLWLVVSRFGLFRADVRGKADWPLLRELLRLGWPASVQLVARIGAMLVVHSLVARYFTTEQDQTATTALGVVFRLETMALFVALGWGNAAQTFVAQNLGAHQLQRAWRSGLVAAAWSALMMVLLAIVYHFHAAALVSLFTSDPAVITLALSYLAVVAPSYLGLGTGVVLGTAIQGAGTSRLTLGLDAFVLLGILVPLSALAAVWGAGSGELGWLWGALSLAYFAYIPAYGLAYWRRGFLKNVVG